MRLELIEIIEEVDNIKKNFQLSGGNGLPQRRIIYQNEIFCKWKQELEFELQRIYDKKHDKFIWRLLTIIHQGFNGWSDEQNFNELVGGLLAIRKNIDLYYSQEIELKEKRKGMDKKIFVSHASADVEYVEKLVDLFIDMGVREDQIFCTSVPGFGIPEGEDIYDYL